MAIVKLQEIKATTNFNKSQSMLNQLIANPPSQSRVVEFTPALAEYVLSNLNLHNRPRKTKKIVQYAKDMAEDKWLLTGETIAFGSDGLLKDGQNRLAACIRSNTSFRTHVMFGIDPKAFAVMDTGANRSHQDVFSMMGVKNAHKVSSTLKLYLAWGAGRTNTGGATTISTNPTNEEMRQYYIDHINEDAMQRAVLLAQVANKVTGYPNSYLAAIYYKAFENGDEKIAIDFLEKMRDGLGAARSPQKALIKHLVMVKSNPSYTLTTHDYGVLIHRAFYAFKHNKKMLKEDFIVLNTDKLVSIQ